MYLLCHSQKVHREEDGAVHFWRINENLQNPLPQSIHWSDSRWKACLAAGGGSKRRYQYCSDNLGTIVYFRALQGHSGHTLPPEMLAVFFFYSGGVNFLMQLQFLAPVELFFKQLKGYSF